MPRRKMSSPNEHSLSRKWDIQKMERKKHFVNRAWVSNIPRSTHSGIARALPAGFRLLHRKRDTVAVFMRAKRGIFFTAKVTNTRMLVVWPCSSLLSQTDTGIFLLLSLFCFKAVLCLSSGRVCVCLIKAQCKAGERDVCVWLLLHRMFANRTKTLKVLSGEWFSKQFRKIDAP